MDGSEKRRLKAMVMQEIEEEWKRTDIDTKEANLAAKGIEAPPETMVEILEDLNSRNFVNNPRGTREIIEPDWMVQQRSD
jgi:hypothetical protein